jgi:dipeptidyl aminopeptidase/acylaminoacyl peptidase
MVVLIHGGPQVRDRWQWNAEVQMLASHGYAVFQPQFRGSTGFGRRFEEAGYRQWGRAMQDDITDGVMYLVAQKIADPARICIYGASYGGYAALWGVIKTPDLYKCGVSFAGVSDLGSMLSHSIMDDSTAASRESHRVRIGDPEEARAQLDEVSPLKHAAQVRVPLLIAYGEEDQRVLPSQSKDMVKALRDLGKTVAWMPFEGAGHGFFWTRDELRYYAVLLAFFKRYIGDPDPPAAGGASAPVADAPPEPPR